jgi:2-polyprenyl-3-methyl-5-hydroxy-6-metoxy-1,4-benzoquinol methylase
MSRRKQWAAILAVDFPAEKQNLAADVVLASPTACRLCGSTKTRSRERRGSYRYVQCVRCSLTFLPYPPAPDEVVRQYQAGVSSKLAYYRMATRADQRSFRELLGTIERYSAPGRILDVGCNIGNFVKVAKERGWSATGLDVNAEAVAYGREHFGLDLVTPVEFDARGLGDFEVVHSSDTIEHFSNPAESLEYFTSKCKPGGLIVLSTPNYDSVVCRLFQLKPSEHIYLFNRHSLLLLLERLNLETIETLYFDRYRNVSAMFESNTFDSLPPLKSALRLLHRFMPELPLRLPARENIVAFARRAVADATGGAQLSNWASGATMRSGRGAVLSE